MDDVLLTDHDARQTTSLDWLMSLGGSVEFHSGSGSLTVKAAFVFGSRKQYFFQLGTGQVFSFKDIVEALCQAIGITPPGDLPQPFDGIYRAKISPAIRLAATPQGQKGQLVARFEFMSDDGAKPEPLGLWFLKVYAIELIYGPQGFDFNAEIAVFGQRKTAQYPFPVEPPTPPILDLRYFGIGQRLDIKTKAMDVAGALADMRNTLKPVSADPDDPGAAASIARQMQALADLYAPANNFLLGFDLSVRNTVSLKAVFNDPNLYGLWVGLDGSAWKGLAFEIVYKKVTDSIGMYAVDLSLPPVLRTFQVGAGSLTLPCISIIIYTNGDFRIAIGWPLGDRSLTIQYLAFMGSGGFYIAKLSGSTAPEIPNADQYGLVLAFGIAMKIGLGRSLSMGILSASLSISLFGVFEGRLAWKKAAAMLPARSAAGESVDPVPAYWWFQGTFGIEAVIQGTVDFVIAKASVMIRVVASATVVFETARPTNVVLYASVDVSLSVEIGGFSLFGVRIAITIDLSFHASITESFQLDGGSSSANLVTARSRTALTPVTTRPFLTMAHRAHKARFLSSGDDTPVHLTFVPQITVVRPDGTDGGTGNGTVCFVAGFTISTAGTADKPSDFQRVAQAYVGHALLAHLWETDADPEAVGWHEVRSLGERLTVGRWLNSRRLAEGERRDYDEIIRILTEDAGLTFTLAPLDAPTSTTTSTVTAAPDGAVFPMLKEIVLKETIDGTLAHEIDFAKHNPKDQGYGEALADYFDSLSSAFAAPHATKADRMTAAEGDPPSSAMLIFEDYFAFILKDVADGLRRSFIDEAGEPDTTRRMSVDALMQSVDWGQVAAKLSRYIQYGMRPPSGTSIPTDPSQWPDLPVDALYAMTGQQFPIDFDLSKAPAYGVSLEPAKVPWLSATGDLAYRIPAGDAGADARKRLAALQAVAVGADVLSKTAAPGLTAQRLHFALRNTTPCTGPDAAALRLVTLSAPVLGAVTRFAGLPGSLFAGDPDTASPLDAAPALRLDLTLRRTRMATGAAVSASGTATGYIPHVYQLGGADEAGAQQLHALLEAWDSTAPPRVLLLYSPHPDQPEMAFQAMDLSATLLVKTNLSTERHAPQALAAIVEDGRDGGRASDDTPVSAPLGDARSFLTLVWQLSVVSAGGYYLNYAAADGSDLPVDTVFPPGVEQARFALVVAFPASKAITLRPCQNALLIPDPAPDAEDGSAPAFCLQSTDALDHDATVPAGCVGFGIDRGNPRRQALDLTPHQRAALGRKMARAGKPVDLVELSATARGLRALDRSRVMDGSDSDTAQIRGLYNLVSFRVGAGDGFSASVWSAPMGPEQQTTGHEARLRQRAARVRALALLPEPASWLYHATPAVYRWSSQALRSGDAPNRYTGVGGTVSIEFEIRDIFGNRLPDAAQGPNPLTPLAIDLRYWDRLVGPDAWPGFDMAYQIVEKAGKPVLLLSAGFDPKPIIGDGANTGPAVGSEGVRQALVVYDLVYDQLTAPSVEARLMSTLGTGLESGALLPLLTAFVDQVRSRLRSLMNGTSDDRTPIPLALPDLALKPGLPDVPDSLFRISVWFVVARTALLGDQVATLNPAAAQASSSVPPAIPSEKTPKAEKTEGGAEETADGGETQRLALFAKAFEDALSEKDGQGTPVRQLRLAVGQPEALPADTVDPSGAPTSDQIPLWAVRFDSTGDAGWSLSVRMSDVRFFLPAPLSTSLVSGAITEVSPFDPSNPAGRPPQNSSTLTLSGIDLDTWGRGFLSFFDEFLAPEHAIGLRRFADGATFATFMDIKERLATAVTARMVSVLAQDAPDAALAAAAEKLRQKMLVSLSSGYDVNAVVAVPVDIANNHPGKADASRLYGTPIDSGPANDGPAGTYSDTALDLAPGTSWLAFTFTSARPTLRGNYSSTLRFPVAFLEHAIADGDADTYRQSSWLKFIRPLEPDAAPSGPLVLDIGPVAIPIALRQYPTPPDLTGQSATPEPAAPGARLGDRLAWRYTLSYRRPSVAQDTIFLAADYNTGTAAEPPQRSSRMTALAGRRRPPPTSLYEALGRFTAEVASYRPLLDRLKPDAAKPDSALDALIAWFAETAGDIADWWSPKTPSRNLRLRSAGTLDLIHEQYWLLETDRIDCGLIQRQQPMPIPYAMTAPASPKADGPAPPLYLAVAAFQRKDAWGQSPPAGLPSLPESVDGVPAMKVCPPVETSKTPQDPFTKGILSQDLPPYQLGFYPVQPADGDTVLRTLAIRQNSIMLRQDALAGLQVVRNSHLGLPQPTNPAFLYETPMVSAPTPVAATVTIPVTDPLSLDVYSGTGLRAHLSAFLTDLFSLPERLDQSVRDNAVSANQRLLSCETMYEYVEEGGEVRPVRAQPRRPGPDAQPALSPDGLPMRGRCRRKVGSNRRRGPLLQPALLRGRPPGGALQRRLVLGGARVPGGIPRAPGGGVAPDVGLHDPPAVRGHRDRRSAGMRG